MAATVNRAALAAARQRLEQAPRDVLSAVTADLVQATPVKAGFLRASWSVSADGSAAPGIAAEPDPGEADTVARLQAAIQAAPAGAMLRFSNGAPYAGFVEFGTVKAPPQAFVRGTLARAPVIAAEAVARGPST